MTLFLWSIRILNLSALETSGNWHEALMTAFAPAPTQEENMNFNQACSKAQCLR